MAWRCDIEEHVNETHILACEICDNPRPSGVIYYKIFSKEIELSWELSNCDTFRIGTKTLPPKGKEVLAFKKKFKLAVSVSNEFTTLSKTFDYSVFVEKPSYKEPFEIELLPASGLTFIQKIYHATRGERVNVTFKVDPAINNLIITEDGKEREYTRESMPESFLSTTIESDKQLLFRWQDSLGTVFTESIQIYSYPSLNVLAPPQPEKDNYYQDERIKLIWRFENSKSLSLVTSSGVVNDLPLRHDSYQLIPEPDDIPTCVLKFIAENLTGKFYTYPIIIPVFRLPEIEIHTDKAPSWKVPRSTTVSISWKTKNVQRVRIKGIDHLFETNDTYAITITEDTRELTFFAYGLDGKRKVTRTITLTTYPPTKTIHFNKLEPHILHGDKITLEWKVAHFSKLTLSGPAMEEVDVTELSEFTIKTNKRLVTEKSLTYNLGVTDLGGELLPLVKTIIYAFPRPFIREFCLSSEAVIPGNAITISWNVVHFSKISLHIGKNTWDVTGQHEFTCYPDGFTEICIEVEALKGLAKIKSRTLHVQVITPLSIHFTSSACITVKGRPVEISWQVLTANEVQLSTETEVLMGLPKQGKLSVYPIEDFTYTLKAINKAESKTSHLKISVLPAPHLRGFRLPHSPELLNKFPGSALEPPMLFPITAPIKSIPSIHRKLTIESADTILEYAITRLGLFFVTTSDRKNISLLLLGIKLNEGVFSRLKKTLTFPTK